MTIKDKEHFRKWMETQFGRQDADDYAGTFTEEIAIRYAQAKLYKEDQNIEDIVVEQIKLYRNDVSMTSHRIARIILRKIRKLNLRKVCKHCGAKNYSCYLPHLCRR